MQFSIIVPTFKNYRYLKTSINSITVDTKLLLESRLVLVFVIELSLLVTVTSSLVEVT